MKKTFLTLIAILSVPFVSHASILGVQSGGTGASTLTGCLTGNGIGPITGTGVACGSGGGGSGGGTWATTTSSVPGRLINYSLNNTDIITIGGSSTSTAKFIFDPNSQFGYFSGSLGIGTKSPLYNLDVSNGTGNIKYASTTQLTLLGNLYDTGNLLGTAGQILMDTASGVKWVATTTFSSPLIYSAGNVTCQTATGSVPGCLSSADWTTFNGKGSGTVTAVSVASANGFAGSSSGGATPALTLTTSVTGVLKGNGTAISAASNGTDYTLLTATNCGAGNAGNNFTAAGSITCTAAFSTTSADAYINASSTIPHPAGGIAGNLIEWDGSKYVTVATTSSALGLQPRIGLTTSGSSGAATFDGTTLNIPQYSGGGGVWPFTTTDTNYGVAVQSTTTPEWFKNGVFASSTSQFANASTTLLTVAKNLYLSNASCASANCLLTETTASAGIVNYSAYNFGSNQVLYSPDGSGIVGSSNFGFNGTLVTAANATTTLLSASYASSTLGYFGTLNLPNITGTQCLHSISGVVSGTGSDCGAGSGLAWMFAGTGNATSTLTQFNGGLTAYASSTIGGGGVTTGLTTFGNGTTTGAIIQTGSATSTYAGPVTIGPSTASTTFAVDYAGHMITGGNVPTCTTNCGSSPNIWGDDSNFRFVTGSAVSSAVITFATKWTNSAGNQITPVCEPTDESLVTTGVEASSTPTTVTLSFASALTTKFISVQCMASDNFIF